MATILARLKEPSTWAGVSALLGVFGIHVVPEVWTGIVSVLVAAAGLAAVFMPEKSA